MFLTSYELAAADFAANADDDRMHCLSWEYWMTFFSVEMNVRAYQSIFFMIVYHHPHNTSHYVSGSNMTQVAIVSVWLKPMNNKEGKTIVGTQFLIYSGKHCSFQIGSEAIHMPLFLIALYHHTSTMKNRSNLYEIIDNIVPPIVVPGYCNGYHHVSNLYMGWKYPGELRQHSWFVSSPH